MTEITAVVQGVQISGTVNDSSGLDYQLPALTNGLDTMCKNVHQYFRPANTATNMGQKYLYTSASFI